MPCRNEPLVTGEIYHIFNKTIESKEIFKDKTVENLLLDLFGYYKSLKATISYSKLKFVDLQIRKQILKNVSESKSFKVEIFCFCLMPTHFHLLLRQKVDNGIRMFVSDIVNSITKTFNLVNNRTGPIFIPRFKSVRIISEEQLIHVFRYIHLNPYSSRLINDFYSLQKYHFSSLIDYVYSYKTHSFVDRDFF